MGGCMDGRVDAWTEGIIDVSLDVRADEDVS